jgi:uncharacterized membrane protein SirB2
MSNEREGNKWMIGELSGLIVMIVLNLLLLNNQQSIVRNVYVTLANTIEINA